MGTPHKHAEVIKAWADGAEIECFNPLNPKAGWYVTRHPQWDTDWEYRVKPPRVFPKSSLSTETLARVYASAYGAGAVDPGIYSNNKKAAIKAVADAAIKQYILDTEAKADNEWVLRNFRKSLYTEAKQ